MFQPTHVEYFRKTYPGIRIIVHPECHEDVVNQADAVGSTERIIRTVKEAEPGTLWAVGTELNLVNRLKNEETDKQVFFPVPHRLPVRDHVPHRCRPPVLEYGESRARLCGESDFRAGRRKGPGPACARSNDGSQLTSGNDGHAGAAFTLVPFLLLSRVHLNNGL